ncbi:emp24/gp25L/p24 family/GOLD dimain [Cryptosporidium hominis]|uniref:Emp24/gp25L/p24 family/GOLD dimain n=1 Tax=Cryptosporidium hominis TaxID=237895 RepID=A0ABX5BBC8_CRYHO|nr:emp24/gp25L/p24 family/GOLD dimain [Cryptosporidium hominis]|eukprot:PPS94764.1 emp24/gp25L/p24 family/GOLD dimain [Cryptosporidium hominis]
MKAFQSATIKAIILFLIIKYTRVYSAIYFYVQEGTEKCFIQEVPKSVPIHVKYENVNNLVIFKNTEDIEVFSRHVNENDHKGSVAYLPEVDGDHKVCIRCDSSNWFKSEQMKWILSIDTGNISEHLDVDSIASKDEANYVEEFINSLISKVNNQVSEGEYEFEKQETFLKQALSVNKRIVIYSIIQLTLVSIISYFSIVHMRNFLRKQRII